MSLIRTYERYRKLRMFEEPPVDDSEPGNLILSKHLRLNMNKRSNLNNNIVVVGGPGTGKSRGIIKPNMLQFNTSYVITDPKGELLHDMGTSLLEAGYHIKCFNLFEMQHSCGYNPFRYIRNDEQVMTLIDCIIKNTDTAGASKGDQFFEQAVQALLLAIFYYIYYFLPPEERNMRMVMTMLGEAEVDENNPRALSALDKRFKEVEFGNGQINPHITKADPNHVSLRSYRIFKQGSGKTSKNILISAQVRLAPFNIRAVENITMHDDLHLEEIGESKQALFMIIPEGASPYMFLASMVYTQLFSVLYEQCKLDNINTHQLVKGNTCALRSELFSSKKTEKKTLEDAEEKRKRYLRAKIKTVERGDEDTKFKVYQLTEDDGNVLREFQGPKEAELYMDTLKNGKWVHGNRFTTVPVHFLLDEFKNTGEIPSFDKYLSTMRSYHISCTIILQSIDQLKAMYEHDYGTIMGDCSTQIFLGSTNPEDLKYFSESLGAGTQTTRNTSSGGGKGGDSHSYNQDEFTLMKPDQLRTMPSTDCVVLVSGMDPFYDEKFNLTEHPHYNDKIEMFDYHLYFNLKDYVAEMPAQKTEFPAEIERTIALQNVTKIPEVRELDRRRREEIQKHTRCTPGPLPLSESLAECAAAQGLDELEQKVYESAATVGDLAPLIKKPYPPKKYTPDANKIAPEVVMYGDSGYPV